MIRDLRKAAESAEHERFACAQTAQRLRRSASASSAAALSPVPEVVVCASAVAPRKRRASALSKRQSKRVSVRPAPAPAPASAQASREPTATPALVSDALDVDDKALAPTALAHLARLQRRQAWRVWCIAATERRRLLDNARRAIQRLTHPCMARGWRSWVEWRRGRAWALQQYSSAFSHYSMMAEFAALQQWVQVCGARRISTAAPPAGEPAAEMANVPPPPPPPPSDPAARACRAVGRCLGNINN